MTVRLLFPSDISIGRVLVRDERSHTLWHVFAEARGEVMVPAINDIGLQVDKHAFTTLKSLPQFAFSSLCFLDLSEVKVSDEDLTYLNSLTELRELHIVKAPGARLSCVRLND